MLEMRKKADFLERNKDVSFGHVEFEEAIGYVREDIQSMIRNMI